MRCCVPGCKSNSKQNKKAQGITFHVLPSEQTLRSCWVKALNIDNWSPRDHSAVCSKHFQIDDMYETKSGMRKIRVGAVPMLLKGRTNCGYQEMVPLLACRICLATETKMYAMKEYSLDEAYASVTGLSLSPEDKLPQMLCVECAQRIQNHVKFVRKSHAANSIMLELVRKHDVLTLEAVKSINRDKKLLSSPLSLKLYNSCHYDLQIEYDDVTDVNTSSNDHNHSLLQDDIVSNFDIKVESSNNEVFISENEDFNQADDMKDDFAVHKENIIVNDENGGYIDNENQNDDTNEAMDVDFSISPKDGEEFSTDDSMPLELSRTKKKVKTKKKEEKIKTPRKRQLKKEQSEPKIDRRRKPFLSDELNETLFTITDLTFEEQVAEIQKRQESANYKNSVYKCTECFKGFLDEDAYNGHMSRHTHECGDHQCDICKTYFRHSHALRKHITAHHTQRFSCNQCPYVTTHRQTARLHERWHKGTKYQCPHCQDEFVKFTTYMGHIRIKHPSDFVCALCGYSFVSQKGIELHKKLKHRVDTLEIPEDGPLCEPCNVRFVSSDALRQHLRVSARHSGGDLDSREANKPRKGRKSKEAKERERRLRDKNDKDMDDRPLYPSQMRKAEGPIPCEQCGLQLEDSRAYHGHFRRVHPDKNRTNYPSMKSPCMCEVCGRMFQSYALLKDHRWTHTGERPFGCDSCGKRFRMRQRLVAHRRVHSLEKASYLCNLCGKHFSTHSNRQRHMFIHTGLKPFKCEMCGKCFKHASEKRAHITYVHLKKPWPKRSRGKRRSERQGSVPPQPMPGASEIALPQQQVWPCEKLDLPPSIDKPVYYNLKI